MDCRPHSQNSLDVAAPQLIQSLLLFSLNTNTHPHFHSLTKNTNIIRSQNGTVFLTMSDSKPRSAPPALHKQNSWSPDILRDEAWSNRSRNHRLRRGRSVTDDDLNELRACFELGFQFDSPDLDPKLSSTFPALEFYYAVNRHYGNSTTTLYSRSSSSTASFCDLDSAGSPSSILSPGLDPKMVKTRLRQWAQVVACSVHQFSPNFD